MLQELSKPWSVHKDDRDGENAGWSNGEDLSKEAGLQLDADGPWHISSRGQEEKSPGWGGSVS